MLDHYKNKKTIIFIVMPMFVGIFVYLRFGSLAPSKITNRVCPDSCENVWSSALGMLFSWTSLFVLFAAVFFTFLFSSISFWFYEYFNEDEGK